MWLKRKMSFIAYREVNGKGIFFFFLEKGKR